MAKMNAAQLGLSNFKFDMKGVCTKHKQYAVHSLRPTSADIMSTSAVLLVVALLMACSTLLFSIALAQDIVSQVHKIQSHGQTEMTLKIPRTTKTLGFQAATLAFLTTWLFSVLIPSTVFSRTREAMVSINGVMLSPGMSPTDPIYWDYGFCACQVFPPFLAVLTTSSEVSSGSSVVYFHIFLSGNSSFHCSMEDVEEFASTCQRSTHQDGRGLTSLY